MKILTKNILIPLLLILLVTCTFASFSQDKIVIKLGHHHNVGGQADQLANKFAELAAEKSNGQLEVEVFPGAQLGQEREASEGVLMGTLQMTAVSSANYDRVANGWGVDFLPFLFKDLNELIWVMNDSPVADELNARLLEKGGRNLGNMVFGARDMLFVDKEIKTVEGIRGLKMRSPESDLYIGMFEALGARPTPITWGEVYTALQTGVADGMESPPVGTKDMKFYEVTKYCLVTNHMMGTFNLIINEDLFQRLPENIQDIIVEAGREAVDYVNKEMIQQDQEAITFLKEQGMIFNYPSEEELAKFKDSMEPVIENWSKKYNAEDIVSQIRELTL